MAVTMQQKKDDAKSITLYMSVVICIICFYAFGHIGSLMETHNLTVFSGLARFMSDMKEGSLFFPLNSGAVIGMACALAVGPIIYFLMKNDTERNMSYNSDEVSGTGGFMTPKQMKEYNQKYIDHEPTNEDEPSPNMIMSDSFYRPINSRTIIGNNNVLVVGSAGTGKSRFFIKPNVLQMNASYVITDPSGEMIFSMGDTLQKHGYKIKIFNISDMAHSNCYNPLEYIRNEAGVSMLIECFIRNTTGKGNKGDEFFTNAEKLLYSACIFYLLDFCRDESNKNFSSVLNLVNASQVDENNPSTKSPLDIIFESLPQDSIAWKYYKAFKQAAGKTLKSIIISCVTRLQPFMTPQVINLTKTDNLELDKIGDEKTALFIITPQADKTYSFLASMLYSQLFETLYFKGEQQKANGGSEQMVIPVRCLMDEFANIGEVPEFPSKLSTMRKYNISAAVILQDLSQIESLYEKDWRNLVGNCSSIVMLGATEQNTLKYFSDMLGEMTITDKSRGQSHGGKTGSNKNFQQKSRKVMTEEELRRLPEKECIVYTQNMRPVRDLKYRLEHHPRYKQMADNEQSPNAFMYKKIAAYDNTRPVNINSLLKARAETIRHRGLEKDVTNPRHVDDIMIDEDMNEALNKTMFDKSTEAKAFQTYMESGIEYATLTYNSSVSIFCLDGIPSNRLPELLLSISTSVQKTPMIIFTDIGSNDQMIYGCGIDRNHDGLLEAMQTDYTKYLKSDDKGLILTMIKKNVFDKYVWEVNDKFDSINEKGKSGESNQRGANKVKNLETEIIQSIEIEEINGIDDQDIGLEF